MRRTRFAIALGVPGLAVLAALGTSPQPGLTETSERLPAPGATTTAAVPTAAAASMAQPVVVPRAVAAANRGVDAAFTASGVTAGHAALLDVPAVVASAYATAVASAPASCRIGVPLLAAVGQVESGNLVGHRLDARHRAVPAVVGPRLDGKAFAAVPDTDNGVLDGDAKWDRAVGPMQFLPSTWRTVGVDMDRDGVRDPQDIDDAAGAAMVYLCSGGRDLATPAGVRAAVLSYNRSEDYLAQVLAWRDLFATSTTGSAAGFGSWAVPGTSTPAPAPTRGTTPVRTVKVPTTAVRGPASGPVPHSSAPGGHGTATQPGTTTPGATTPATPAVTKPGSGPTTGPTTGPVATPTTPTPAGTPAATDGPTPTGGPTPTTGAGHEPTGQPTATPTPTPTPTPKPTPTTPADATTETGPLPTCPVPSASDPLVLVDVRTGLAVVGDFSGAVPVDAADTTTPVPTSTDLDHPTACTPVIDPATGLPTTHVIG